MLSSLLATIALAQVPEMPPNWVDVPIEHIAIKCQKESDFLALVIVAEDK